MHDAALPGVTLSMPVRAPAVPTTPPFKADTAPELTAPELATLPSLRHVRPGVQVLQQRPRYSVEETPDKNIVSGDLRGVRIAF